MGPLRLGILLIGLAILALELALGVQPSGMLASLAGVAILYSLARLGRPKPPQ